MLEGNLYTEIPDDIPEEIFQTLIKTDSIRIERIVSHGHISADNFWYDQDEHEWVLLLDGQASIEFENTDVHELHAGDFLNIPAHVKHRVVYTHPDKPSIWLAIFYS